MRTRFTSDTSEVNALAGYLDGLSATVSTKAYIDGAIGYTESILSEEFGIALDHIARQYPLKYRHVYEWGSSHGDLSTVGNPMARLWALKSYGRGGKRTLGFTFLPSVIPSPIHPELLEPGPTGKSVKPEVHIFTWKAPIIEYRLPVVIRPQLSKALAFYDNDDEEIVITNTTIRATPGKANNASGSFTTFFINWWTGRANKVFDGRVRPVLENDLKTTTQLKSVVGQFRRRKKMTIGIDNKNGYKAGKAAAKQQFGRANGKYIAEAAQRRFDLYGD